MPSGDHGCIDIEQDQPHRKQCLVVMRHGLRQDEVQKDWSSTSPRPWDPPLCSDGLAMARAAAKELAAFNVQQIVCSPFLRCFQTARKLQDALQLPQHALELDWQICEVLTKRFLAGDLWEPPVCSIAEWMWSSTDATSPRENHSASALSSENGGGESGNSAAEPPLLKEMEGIQWCSAPSTPPAYPESTEQAHARYTAALEAIADRHAGVNVLVITHGEAVRRSVARLLPWAMVYEVRHCGFTAAWREQDADGEWDAWELEDQDHERGVSWVA